MNPDLLQRVMPYAGARASVFAQPLTDAMTRWGIDSPIRQAMFLANIAAETASLSEIVERSDGSAYIDRMGNQTPLEARLYIGRGCLQVTGHDNYAACGQALNLPLLTNPTYLEQPEWAAQSAGWFWATNGLNEVADKRQFGSVCHRINGGWNGIDERIECYRIACKALGL